MKVVTRSLVLIAVVLALGVLALGVPTAGASPLTYGINTDSNLFVVDVAGGGKTLVGNTGVFLEGLALSPGGILFGTDTGGSLYQINRTTAAATLIGGSGLGNIEGLDFNGTSLLATNFGSTPTVFALNTSTGVATPVVAAATSTGLVRTMAVLDANTVLLRGDGPPNNNLYSLNLATGAVSSIGPLAVNGNVLAAMDFLSDGQLYALDNEGSVWRINAATAAVTLLGNTGATDFWLDMTSGPDDLTATPEPATLILFGTGLAAMAWKRARRQT